MKKKLKALGEFGLIERISRRTKVDKSVIQGIGDDAAVLRFGRDKYLLLASDMLIEGVHFRREAAPPELIGHKALAVNISDIAAMGGIPRYALISVGLPEDSSIEFADRLYEGIRKLARKFKINIVGGDTSSSPELIIDIALLGEVKKRHLTLRSGARVGDAVMVTGRLGGSRAGKHLKFTPRLKEAQFLVKNFALHSMIDISDGLSSDLKQMVKASRVGAVIYEELIPVSNCAASLNSALNEGEDFELLFTLPEAEAKKLARKSLRKFKVKQIGRIVAGKEGIKLVRPSGKAHPLPAAGFRHLQGKVKQL